jgi:hypothetical protein
VDALTESGGHHLPKTPTDAVLSHSRFGPQVPGDDPERVHTEAHVSSWSPRCGGQRRADAVLADRPGPYGEPHTGVPVACRQLSASGPASTTPYPMDPMNPMNSVTATFARAESPAIGRTDLTEPGS